MSKVQTLRAFVNQRLSAAAEEIFDVFERTIAEYEEELCRQQKLLDAVLKPEVRLHRADVQLLLVSKEEDPPEQQESSPSLDQEDPAELPHIKEEQEELWTSQEGEFTFTPVPVKSEEDDEEKLQSSQLHQRQTEQMKTEADGEDCGGPEPARNFNSDSHLQPDTDDKIEDFSKPEPEDSDKWKISSEPQSGLNFVKNHSACDTGEKSLNCSECGKYFRQNSNLKTHIRIHTGEKPPSCSVCSRRFIRKVNLTRHTMALRTGEKKYSCNICDKRFTWSSQLKNHQCVGRQSSQLHRSQAEENRDDGEDCGGPEPDTDEKSLHSSVPETDDGCVWEESRELQSGLNPLQNDEVPVSDEEGSTGKASASSSECATSFGQKGSETEVNLFSCSVCGKGYHWKSSFRRHMKLHSEGKRFTCMVCKKSFQCRRNVVRHMRIHTGEKPFTCSVCGKGFTQKETLIQHMRVHTGEKPFSCLVCGIRFTQKTHLRRHLTVPHEGEIIQSQLSWT